MPSGLYKRLGINIVHLRAILMAKLTMDNRRPAAFQQMRHSKEKKELNKATLKTMLASFFMGLLFLFAFGIGHDLTTKLTLFFSMFIFMLAATLITDFTSVLIDIRDNLIILPKPVNDSTFLTARLLHIAIHVNKMALPMAFPAMIAVILISGFWTLIPFLFFLLLATMVSIFLINAVYILILKITTPSKFQSIISYIQIGFAILIYGGYQLVPRIMENSVMKDISISSVQYIRFFPPFWFAEACNSLSCFTFGPNAWISTGLAVFVPLGSIYLVMKYFAPAFNQKLGLINSSTVESNKIIKKKQGFNPAYSRIEKLATMLTKDRREYMGFVFAWKMMGRSREFKLKVYPAFGYVIVLLAMLLLKSGSQLFSDFADMTSKGKSLFLMILYFSSFILITAIAQLSYSDKSKAGWIFLTAPLVNPGNVIVGAVKAAMIQFYTPVILIFTIAGTLIVGPGILPNLLLGCFNVLSICSLIAYFNLRELPFSVATSEAAKGRTVIRSMITLIIPAAFGFFQWLIFDYLWIVAIFATLSIIATWMVLGSIRNLGWERLGSYSRNNAQGPN